VTGEIALGEIAAIASALAFGLTNLFAKRSMGAGVSPEASVLATIVLNAAAYGLLAAITAWRGALPPIQPRAVLWFAAGGLAATLVGRNMSFFSIGRLGPSRASTIRLSTVAFALLFGLLLLGELPRPVQIAGIAVVSFGLWISLRPISSRSDSGLAAGAAGRGDAVRDAAGVFSAFGGAAAFALGDVARRGGLALMPSPVLGAAVGAAAALMAHAGWAAVRTSARLPRGAALRNRDLWATAVCSTCAVLLVWIALHHTQVAIVSVLYHLQVLFVFLLSPLLLPGQEAVTRWLALGTGLALAGTVMIVLG
jgi:drug/metabolite transporter (DMT)-like permease